MPGWAPACWVRSWTPGCSSAGSSVAGSALMPVGGLAAVQPLVAFLAGTFFGAASFLQFATAAGAARRAALRLLLVGGGEASCALSHASMVALSSSVSCSPSEAADAYSLPVHSSWLGFDASEGGGSGAVGLPVWRGVVVVAGWVEAVDLQV
ncbi:hypothetical protein DFP73DRAFT_560968 [Morchella snyderi]|nr:hypothetical protein DFP73DRAFT_560968 [Morchella snyderi]